MCGISGIARKEMATEASIRNFLHKFNDALRHRGPDSCGTFIDARNNLGLAHTRLSILDLREVAGQPMTSPCGRWTIVFNGEIYNYRHIKSKLEATGYEFSTTGDTEVLLASIISYGLHETVRIIRGMYAFAYYDSENSLLTLSRDRIGEKPLYYYTDEKTFAFSSELKAIIKSGVIERKAIDHDALSEYLRYGYIPAPLTILENCRKLNPGEALYLDTKSFRISHENLISKLGAPPSLDLESYGQYLSAFNDTLNSVIERQSIADVPLGSFLSGGIDSTLVTAVLQGQRSTPIDTFTIAFEDPRYNEAPFAKRIASHLGTSHSEVLVTNESIKSAISRCSDIFDEPFADASAIPMLLVNMAAKANVKVALSGDGGDELFCGYNRYSHSESMLEKAQRLPRPIKIGLVQAYKRVSSRSINNLYYLGNRVLGKKTFSNAAAKVDKIVSSLSHNSIDRYYEQLCSFWEDPSLVAYPCSRKTRIPFIVDDALGFIESAMKWDAENYLPGDNLVKVDRTSMDCGLEVRAPLLDIDIYDFSRSLPTQFKLFKGEKKRILKDTLSSYVPKPLTERPKMGFTPPLARWINEDLKDEVDHFLGDKYINSQGIFVPSTIKRTLLEHRNEFRDNSNKIWTILMFQKWYEAYYLN